MIMVHLEWKWSVSASQGNLGNASNKSAWSNIFEPTCWTLTSGFKDSYGTLIRPLSCCHSVCLVATCKHAFKATAKVNQAEVFCAAIYNQLKESSFFPNIGKIV